MEEMSTHRILPWRFGMRLSIRAINVFDAILMRMELLRRETIADDWEIHTKTIRHPRRRELSKIGLWEFKRTRNCGPGTITEIHSEMTRVGIVPAFAWPEPLPEPAPPRKRCPTCGHIIYEHSTTN